MPTGATFPPGGRTIRLSGFAPADFAQRIAWVRSAAAGRSPELNVLVQQVVIAETPRSAAEELALRFRLTVDSVLDSPFLLVGPIGHLVETLQARRERWGITYVVVFERAIEDFAPVVARLAGR